MWSFIIVNCWNRQRNWETYIITPSYWTTEELNLNHYNANQIWPIFSPPATTMTDSSGRGLRGELSSANLLDLNTKRVPIFWTRQLKKMVLIFDEIICNIKYWKVYKYIYVTIYTIYSYYTRYDGFTLLTSQNKMNTINPI